VPTINNVQADHHVFVVPGVVDGDVVAEQARKKADKLGESSYVHHHKADVVCGDQYHKGYGNFRVNATLRS
jgi:hypothetical protein